MNARALALVERLRKSASDTSGPRWFTRHIAPDCAEAASLIRSLLEEREALREALSVIESWEPATQEITLAHQMAQVARAALSTQETEHG